MHDTVALHVHATKMSTLLRTLAGNSDFCAHWQPVHTQQTSHAHAENSLFLSKLMYINKNMHMQQIQRFFFRFLNGFLSLRIALLSIKILAEKLQACAAAAIGTRIPLRCSSAQTVDLSGLPMWWQLKPQCTIR